MLCTDSQIFLNRFQYSDCYYSERLEPVTHAQSEICAYLKYCGFKKVGKDCYSISREMNHSNLKRVESGPSSYPDLRGSGLP